MELLYIFYNTINTTTCGLWAFEVYDQELTFKFHLILTTSNFQGCIWLEAFILNIDWVGFPTGSDGKELACNAGDRVLPLGWKDPWRREYSSILAWRIPWTEEPGYSPWSCRESDVTEWLTYTHISPTVSTSHQMWVLALTVPQIFGYIFTLCFSDHYPSLYQRIGLAKMFVQVFCKSLWNTLFGHFNSLE